MSDRTVRTPRRPFDGDLAGRLRSGWETRWGRLAAALSITPDEGLTLALSGGADSVFLLHLLADARPAVAVRAVHVDHGLRGAESDGDREFCVELCASLGIPLTVRRITLDPLGPSLEARAREARYGCLVEEAERTGHRTILTGHHSDDALETVLMRWMRGSSLAGLRGPRREWRPDAGLPDVRVVRPLLALRREEVRELLRQRGLAWREDGSNADNAFTRNRLRNEFVPLFLRLGGEEGLENLRSFGRAVEDLERELARATAHLAWRPPAYVRVSRDAPRRDLGGVLERGLLMHLSPPLRRRALWRLLVEGTGTPPSDEHLARCLELLATGRTSRLNLRGDWQLVLRSDELHLLPPERAGEGPRALALPVPGIVTLGDGRRLSAELVEPAPGSPVPRDGVSVELEAAGLADGPLTVRWAVPGDRFHPLGAPGGRALARYLRDRGVPREERARIPLVFHGEELVWVCGYAPGEGRRVTPATRRRLRLTLHHQIR